MKCAYTCGILDCMIEDGLRADYVIGVSAGAACGASYVQGKKCRNIEGFPRRGRRVPGPQKKTGTLRAYSSAFRYCRGVILYFALKERLK